MTQIVADAWAVADPTTCPVCGRDACEEHLPSPPVTPRTLPVLAFRSAADVARDPAPAEIVEGIAWEDTLTALVAESGAGKTFLMLGLAAAVSAGSRWLGRDVRQGTVAYIPYEGDAFGKRLRALEEVQGFDCEHVYFLRGQEPISPRSGRDAEEIRSPGELRVSGQLEALAAMLEADNKPPIRLLVIDTVRASMTGSEDGSDHVSAYLRAARRIMACIPGAATILVHHAGWQDGEDRKKRERGSSAWRGNVDGTLYLEKTSYDAQRGEAELTLRVSKARDEEVDPPLHCIRRRVELQERNKRGYPATSCVIEADRRTREDRAGEAQTTALRVEQDLDLRTLRVIAEHPDASTSQDKLRMRLGVKRDVVYASLCRLIQHDWIREPEKQRQPYTVSAAGRKALQAGL